MKEILTTCPYCAVGCNLYLQVEDGEVKGLRPSQEHPVNRGRLCPKGATAWQIVHHPDRLTRPLIKRNGRFQEASWEEAYDLIAARFTELKEKYGGSSLGVISSTRGTNEENYLAQKFARAVLGTNNIDQCARICHSATVVGLYRAFGSGAMTNSIKELPGARAIFLIGSNPTEAHPIVGEWLKEALKNGARLVVADPRETELAKRAELHLQHRPGSDIALINAMIHHILEKGWHDKGFIEERTEGFAELERVVEGYPPERMAEVCGVPAEAIKRAAEIYATTEPASIVYCLGITEHRNGVQAVMSLANLAMVTGHVGKESSGVNPLRGQNNVQGACDMGAEPEFLPGYRPITDEEARRKFAEAWGVDLPAPGEELLFCSRMWDRALQGGLKGLYIIGLNPALTEANLNKVRKSLESLEFLVVQDLFLTETAELADVVLPAASFAEKDGTFTSTERRVQLIRKAVEPPGEAKPDWVILQELAQKMGYQMDYSHPREIMAEIASLVPIYGGISYDRLEKNFGLQWPCPAPDHPGTPFLHKERFVRGKGLFHAVRYSPPAEEPDAEYPFLLTTGRLLMQYNSGTMTRRSPQLERGAPEAFIQISAADAERLGIKDGQEVRASSRRGSVEVKAKVGGIKEGVVWMPFHYREAPANLLTNDALDPECGISEVKACAVRIELA